MLLAGIAFHQETSQTNMDINDGCGYVRVMLLAQYSRTLTYPCSINLTHFPIFYNGLPPGLVQVGHW